MPTPLDADHALPTVTRWFALFGAFLTFIVGICHLGENVSTRLVWPKADESFIKDVNGIYFRLALFSLTPEVLIDRWTPIAFGLVGMLVHLRPFNMGFITGCFARFTLFFLILSLFATLPYAGGLGIVFFIYNIIITTVSAALMFWAPYQSASLDIPIGDPRYAPPSHSNTRERSASNGPLKASGGDGRYDQTEAETGRHTHPQQNSSIHGTTATPTGESSARSSLGHHRTHSGNVNAAVYGRGGAPPVQVQHHVQHGAPQSPSLPDPSFAGTQAVYHANDQQLQQAAPQYRQAQVVRPREAGTSAKTAAEMQSGGAVGDFSPPIQVQSSLSNSQFHQHHHHHHQQQQQQQQQELPADPLQVHLGSLGGYDYSREGSRYQTSY
uniref:Uncharacterized protein n=1 Tax=Chromera velia CCMP2878 TaxID=1169474 RepID=A0A0G4GV70_9ALVE|eukprot:Cvel_23525.t1-p1 / transcript=Cvel_23525.t1 / gene=Cvel_23525 / organism=Chromera_velia_CCMP2878 / gene_product=hypothetical protein / transcript_product=hypothetical protein / location=Cvel_scaffold2434:10212-11770(-) / protein_length=382 / sequence_SO=supercontig / SO=protein_coding / is_pseudo=false